LRRVSNFVLPFCGHHVPFFFFFGLSSYLCAAAGARFFRVSVFHQPASRPGPPLAYPLPTPSNASPAQTFQQKRLVNGSIPARRSPEVDFPSPRSSFVFFSRSFFWSITRAPKSGTSQEPPPRGHFSAFTFPPDALSSPPCLTDSGATRPP